MTIRQKRAIWYRIRDKKRESMRRFLCCTGRMDNFRKSKYKTMRGYIAHLMDIAEKLDYPSLYDDCEKAINGNYDALRIFKEA